MATERKIIDRNSLIYWYPKIKNLGIPTPRTEIVLLSEKEKKNYQTCEEDIFNSESLENRVKDCIIKNFILPVFIRTDHFSGKHFWNKTCYIDNIEKIKSNLSELLMQNQMADMIGLPLNAIVVREYLQMDSKFAAFSGEMPVNPERRYSIKNKKVLCHHPYWIKEAIQKGTLKNLPNNWEKIIDEISLETDEEVKLLTDYSQKVAGVLDGFWSVDFCYSKDKKWILIDCAEGERSWHPSDCKYAPKNFRKHDC